ncbi:MAG: NAD(P)-dependent glycerol-3-phosphate dehydrogenase [Myxococcota bacterium]|nr:NAD(P)-dependent glycerol-3-phosphate dehydrogenase [Myxococcota bacterium]
MKVGVVGAGAWGTALAAHAARLGHETWLWAREPEVAQDIERSHENRTFLAGVPLPPSLRASHDLEPVLRDAGLVLLVTPSRFFRDIAARASGLLSADALVLVASKGIEESTLSLLSDVAAQVMPHVGPDRLAFLSGPSFAREVGLGRPADVVVASRGAQAARRVQPLLHAPTFRVYTSEDPIGVQVGGALKNVLAIATGACDGLGLGLNARAALITRGLAEMTRIGVALGADPLTFLGLAGVGDLVLTATGDLSRNRTLGIKVAQGVDPREYLASQRTVAEGYHTAAAAYALTRRLGVEAPITEQVYLVLHERRPLADALQSLLAREFKDELAGIRRP